jgi:hypothetical protein
MFGMGSGASTDLRLGFRGTPFAVVSTRGGHRVRLGEAPDAAARLAGRGPGSSAT